MGSYTALLRNQIGSAKGLFYFAFGFLLGIKLIFHYIYRGKLKMKWSEKIPKEVLDFLVVPEITTAPARQRICTLQVQMQTKIEQSPSEMLVEAHVIFLWQ